MWLVPNKPEHFSLILVARGGCDFAFFLEKGGACRVNVGGLGVSVFLLVSRNAEHFALILVGRLDLGGAWGCDFSLLF